MDRTKFTPNSPGSLVEIRTPLGRCCTFVPAELPPRWDFPTDLWPLLSDAKEALGELNGIGRTLPDERLLLRPLQNREALSSSKIEGTFVTPEQLLLYEMDPKESSRPNDRTADWMEVHNYGIALTRGRELLKTLPVCNRVIKEMHADLMKGVRGKHKAPGEFRTAQVQIGTSGRFIPPPANEIERLMSNLEVYINGTNCGMQPLVRSFIAHYQFETIHPFLDGNGRIGRALLALMTYSWFGHSAPWLYMSAFFERHREEYMDMLYRVSIEGAWTAWIEFCLRGTLLQAKDAIRRCIEFDRLKKEYHERVKDHSPTPRTHQLVESLFIEPIVRIPELAKTLGVTYPTAKVDTEVLKRAGILTDIPDLRPKTLYCPEIFHNAFSETIEGRMEFAPTGAPSSGQARRI
jgi:Fic family protein